MKLSNRVPRSTSTGPKISSNKGSSPQSVFDQSRLVLDTKPKLMAAAKERLRSHYTEVRQIDVDVANANLQSATADLQRAKSEADAATVRSSYSGRSSGNTCLVKWEEVGDKGILELAKVERMYVVAEVAENDIPRVRIGQETSISGDGIPEKLKGKVVQMGLKVSRNSMVLRDPISLTDARIVEVKILLDDADSVKNLINAQVDVRILP